MANTTDLPLDKLGWIAGILDGEGYISILLQRSRNSFCPTVGVTNTSKPMIDELVKLTGLGKSIPRKLKNSNYKQQWRWDLFSVSNICELLLPIFPCLITKKKRAVLIIRFCYEKALGSKDLEHFYAEMKILNTCGESHASNSRIL